MVKKIKIIFMVLFCLVIALSYTSACFSNGGSTVLQIGQSGSEESDNGNYVNQKLNELKNKMVSPPVVLSHKSGEVIYGSGDKELIFIKGYADKGDAIEVYVNEMLDPNMVIVDNNGNFETLNGVEIMEGKNIIKLIAVSPSGIRSNPTEFNLFLSVPQKVDYKVYENAENLKEIKDTYYSEEINPLIYILGNHLPSSRIFIQVNDKMVGEVESDTDGVFELSDVMLKQGNNEIAVWAMSSDGFISAPVFTDISVYRDLDVPYPSGLSGYNQGNANYLSWTTSVNTDFYSYKLVRVEDPCINPEYPADDVIATFSNISTNNYIDSDIISEKSYYYTLWTLDKAGRAVSSNVVAIPRPVYSITITPLPPSGDSTIARREWFYQPFEITNTGNVTFNIQPFMVWIKLVPNTIAEMEISPLWEVHIWNPNEPDQYYYSNEEVFETYVADWVKTDGYTTTEEDTTYSTDGLTKTVTLKEITEKTETGKVNLKRVMTTTTVTTITVTDLTTGIDVVTGPFTDITTEIVEPEKIGTPIEGLKPGEKIIVEVKIQNIAAENGEKIIAHFHFAPVDCDGHYYIDEIVSTGDVTAIGKSRD